MHFVYQRMSPISVRHNSKFSADDVEFVLGPLFGTHYGMDGLRSIISSVDHIFCAYDKKMHRYVGCALVQSHNEKNILYIKLFGVAESNQGQGIGTHLLKSIQKWGERENFSAIILHTQVNNYRAIGLYEKVGFLKQYLLKDFFRPRELPTFVEVYESDAYQMIAYL